MRILIDGVDLTGKTTLARELVTELRRRGLPARSHRGLLALSPARPLFTVPWLLRRQADSEVITGVFVLAYLLDAAALWLRPVCRAPDTLICDGYVDRCVAYAAAGRAARASRWALRIRRWFASFDLAVYLTAPPATRAARLEGRSGADSQDQRSVQELGFAETFTATLCGGMGPRHARRLIVDTSRSTPRAIAAQVLREMHR